MNTLPPGLMISAPASGTGKTSVMLGLSRAFTRDGIAVHVLTVGPVRTPMLEEVRFPMHTLGVEEVGTAVVWLDSLPPNVRLPEVNLNSVEAGPHAPELFVPEAARRLGRTE